MQIQKIQNYDNTNFKGFEFKNAHAKKVFNKKLKETYGPTQKIINEYLKLTADEPQKVIINATNKKINNSDNCLLYATFPNADKLIVDKSYSSTSLYDFIARCAAEIRYKQL